MRTILLYCFKIKRGNLFLEVQKVQCAQLKIGLTEMYKLVMYINRNLYVLQLLEIITLAGRK